MKADTREHAGVKLIYKPIKRNGGQRSGRQTAAGDRNARPSGQAAGRGGERGDERRGGEKQWHTCKQTNKPNFIHIVVS